MSSLDCTVLDSRFAENPFQAGGAALDVEMLRLTADVAETSGPEAMLAVLEGAVRVICPDETHDLAAGQGVLIPAQLPHRLEVAGAALIYRVRAK